MEKLPSSPDLTRRSFLSLTTQTAAAACSIPLLPTPLLRAAESPSPLPAGRSPNALEFTHFPSRLHAFIWRNWNLVPLDRLAATIAATPNQVQEAARSLGLQSPRQVSAAETRRSYLTVIRRNWHLLPYDQLLTLLNWDADQLAFTLREDDFLFVKLGNLKPACPRLEYHSPTAAEKERAAAWAAAAKEHFPAKDEPAPEDLFGFVHELSQPRPLARPPSATEPHYCYSYFALYGDPLLEADLDPYPDGYLARLAECGVTGVWLQGILHKLAPFPWDAELSRNFNQRLENLKKLADRVRRHGMGVYLYLNEPRSMPVSFFRKHPGLEGVREGEFAALCTSAPDVRSFLTEAVSGICRTVPDLAGFFTISGSENLTNCWSHGAGSSCPRCSQRAPAEVIAEVNLSIQKGIDAAAAATRLIVWDWGWHDDWAQDIIRRLPPSAYLMSVS